MVTGRLDTTGRLASWHPWLLSASTAPPAPRPHGDSPATFPNATRRRATPVPDGKHCPKWPDSLGGPHSLQAQPPVTATGPAFGWLSPTSATIVATGSVSFPLGKPAPAKPWAARVTATALLRSEARFPQRGGCLGPESPPPETPSHARAPPPQWEEGRDLGRASQGRKPPPTPPQPAALRSAPRRRPGLTLFRSHFPPQPPLRARVSERLRSREERASERAHRVLPARRQGRTLRAAAGPQAPLRRRARRGPSRPPARCRLRYERGLTGRREPVPSRAARRPRRLPHLSGDPAARGAAAQPGGAEAAPPARHPEPRAAAAWRLCPGPTPSGRPGAASP